MGGLYSTWDSIVYAYMDRGPAFMSRGPGMVYIYIGTPGREGLHPQRDVLCHECGVLLHLLLDGHQIHGLSLTNTQPKHAMEAMHRLCDAYQTNTNKEREGGREGERERERERESMCGRDKHVHT